MPWQEQSPMSLRMQFVVEWQSGAWSMTELCADYQISRKTGYKWATRYEWAGPRGLHDQSRRPRHSPQATPPALVEPLVALRRRHPRWGARKLLALARRRDPRQAWPSPSTVCALLRARGLIRPRRRRRARMPAAPSVLTVPQAPNDLWTTDFKGEFRTQDGRWCYPFTLRDAWSRYILRCDGMLQPTGAGTRRAYERAFAEFGLPTRIRSDNGKPFAGGGLAALSRLSVWWMRLGIVPERIAPGRPDQNGSHEQFHAVLKAETARPPARHLRAQQRRFQAFCAEYNEVRPHDALDEATPADRYQPSTRPLPAQLPAIVYPGHCEVRRVASNGCFRWQGRQIFLTSALDGEDIALEEVEDALWTIRFATITLARFDARRLRVQPLDRERGSAAKPPRP